MEAQAAKKKVGAAAIVGAGAGAGAKGALGRLRAVITDSAWGALAGKAVIAIAGFVVLALVGSGRVGEISPRVGVAEAASASAGVGMKAPPLGSSSASASATTFTTTSTSTSTSTSGGGELAGDAGVVEDGGGAAVTADGKVRINVASEQDLRRLPGIGATRARAILALRERLGRFRRAEDLLRVKGIGRRMLGRLRPLVIIDP
jgi:competence protein ComEA